MEGCIAKICLVLPLLRRCTNAGAVEVCLEMELVHLLHLNLSPEDFQTLLSNSESFRRLQYSRFELHTWHTCTSSLGQSEKHAISTVVSLSFLQTPKSLLLLRKNAPNLFPSQSGDKEVLWLLDAVFSLFPNISESFDVMAQS